MTEYIGYTASGVVLISFLMKNMNTLRMVNCVGCLLFVTYGVLLESIPIIITNLAICGINVFYLIKQQRATPSEAELLD